MRTLVFLLLVSSPCFAQNGLIEAGARPASMGHAYVAAHDTWSTFYNPAGVAKTEDISTFFTYENKHGIEGLNVMAAGFSSKLPLGGMSLTAFRFGDDLYNEQALSLSYGNKFGLASLGVRVNYREFNVEGLGNKKLLTVDVGGIAQFTDQLFFGAFIRNINQAKISDISEERAPTLLNAGLSYRPTLKITLNLEIEKGLEHDSSVKLGAEYKFLEKLAIRTGVSTNPFINYAGLGFITRKITIDYALTKSLDLGMSHQASVKIKIRAVQ
ncbi:MAG: hypothetical protein R3345_02715 [Fulvivirga sp.]|nr:hypothetical protein [Fulvivirga sp.]